MAGSDAEELIRSDVVERLRKGWPGCRVIHELNVSGGARRLDLAAVTSDRIIGVEIKSEKDTLTRLERQAEVFIRAVDLLVTVAHPKHFDMTPWQNGNPRVRLRLEVEGRLPGQIVCWSPIGEPSPLNGHGHHAGFYSWDTAKFWRFMRHPEPTPLLHLLWRGELVRLASDLQIGHAPRANMTTIIAEIRWHASLKEIKHGVCAALRSRHFARADGRMETSDAA